MTYKLRQQARVQLLERMAFAFRALAIAYLAMHAVVSWFAYQASGLSEAVLTFVLLGFGDLYWALRLLRDGNDMQAAVLALVTAIVCFGSWMLRPMLNRWVARFAADMLADADSEISKVARTDDDTQQDDR